MLYVVNRHKFGECLGVFTDYTKASEALNKHLAEKQTEIEHVSSSDAEGCMQVEAKSGEFYTIQVCDIDVYYG